jgi:hypothetical protein
MCKISIALYVCETWSFAVRECEGFENIILRRICDTKIKEISKELKKIP